MTRRISVITVAAFMALAATACTTNEKRTAGYGVGGAALGALAGAAIGGDGRGALTGAAIGAAAGTVAGTVTTTRDGVRYCKYRDSYGRVRERPCN